MKKSIIKFLIAALAVFPIIASCNKTNPGQTDKTKEETTEGIVFPKKYIGTVTVNEKGTINTFENKTVILYKEKDNKLTVVFEKSKFSQKMPVTLDVNIEGVNCNTLTNGDIKITGDKIIPTTGGIEFKKYIVTGLKGLANKSGMAISLAFGQYKTTFESGDVKLNMIPQDGSDIVK